MLTRARALAADAFARLIVACARAEGLGGLAAAESGNSKMATVAKMRGIEQAKIAFDGPHGLAWFMAFLPIQNVRVREAILPIAIECERRANDGTVTTLRTILCHIFLFDNKLSALM